MEETITLNEPTISESAANKLNNRYLAAHDSDEAIEIAAEIRNTLAFKRLGFTTWSAWYKSATDNFILVEKEKVEQRILELSRIPGETQKSIAAKTGVSQQTVGRAIKKQRQQNIHNRENGYSTNANKDVEQQIKNLWAAGESQQGIADRIGINRNAVRTVIKREGLDQPTSNVTPITQKFHKRFIGMAEDLKFIIQKATEDGGFAAATYDQIDLLTEQRDQLTTLIEKLHKQFDEMPPMACATAL